MKNVHTIFSEPFNQLYSDYFGVLFCSVLIEYVENKNTNKNEYEWKGYVYALGFFLIALLQSTFFHQNFHIGMTLGMRIRSALIAAVYKKVIHSLHCDILKMFAQMLEFFLIFFLCLIWAKLHVPVAVNYFCQAFQAIW